MKSICIAALFAAATLAAAPADFAGTWKVKFEGPPREGPKTIGSMIFDFKINAARVTGMAHIGSWPGLAPIADGIVDGNHLSFTATGRLPSTTGIPTCQFEATLSGGELLIKLSTVRNPGGPGSGGVYEYRGSKLDAAAARTEKLSALNTLSTARTFQGYAEPDPPPPAGIDATLKQRAPRLAADIALWESVKPDPQGTHSDAFTGEQLDDLIAFYNSPAGQSLIHEPQSAGGIQTAVARFIAP
jgi:hypothetical protein